MHGDEESNCTIIVVVVVVVIVVDEIYLLMNKASRNGTVGSRMLSIYLF